MNKKIMLSLVCVAVFALHADQHNIFIKEITDADFETHVLKNEKPVIVDFYAEWCGPCKTFKPLFELLAEKYHEQYQFASVNIDKAPITKKQYNITQIPTFAVFNKGTLHGTFVGVMPVEADIKKALETDCKNGPVSNAPQIPQEQLFIQAIFTGDCNQLSELIKKGANINHVFKITIPFGKYAGKESEFTALSSALSVNNTQIARILLDAGADANLLFKYLDGSLVNAKQYLEKSKQDYVSEVDKTIAFLDEYMTKK